MKERRNPVSRARGIIGHSRKPFAVLIEKQRQRVTKLDERIGHLMSQRADEEEVLAEIIRCAPECAEVAR